MACSHHHILLDVGKMMSKEVAVIKSPILEHFIQCIALVSYEHTIFTISFSLNSRAAGVEYQLLHIHELKLGKKKIKNTFLNGKHISPII